MHATPRAIRRAPHSDAENVSPHTPAAARSPTKTTLPSPAKLGYRNGGLLPLSSPAKLGHSEAGPLPLFNVRVLALEGGAVRWYVVRISITGRSWQVTRRYSEFAQLYSRLQLLSASSLPDLPGKVLLHTQLELCTRVVGLQRFCDRILQQAHCKHSRQGPGFFTVLYEFFGLDHGIWRRMSPSRAAGWVDRSQVQGVVLLQAHARRRAQQRAFRQQLGAASTLQAAARAKAAHRRAKVPAQQCVALQPHGTAALLTMVTAAVLIGLKGHARSVA